MGSASVISRGQYLASARTLISKDIALDPPQPHEVQIVPRSTTICGSDLHYHGHGRNGNIFIKEPLCLGHESAGEIVDVGSEVKDFKIGDRVAIECGVPCSDCEFCVEGQYNICPKLRFRGSGAAFPHFQGTLQERINHPAKWVHRLPDSLSYDDGALLEPLAVACHAVKRSQIKPGASCLIIGAGPVGLLCAAVARYKGCRRIAICDIDEQRVNFALSKGFASIGHIVGRQAATDIEEQMANARETASRIGEEKWADGADVDRLHVTFECTGVPSCVQTAIYATRSGGRVMLVGMGTPNHTLPLAEIGSREIDLVPTWRYASCYQEAIELMNLAAKGLFRPDLRELITHRFEGLDRVSDALAMASTPCADNGDLVIKVAIRNTNVTDR